MSTPSQPLLRREGERHERRPVPGRREAHDPRHGGSRTRGPAQAEARKRNPAGGRVPWHELQTSFLRYLPLAVLATVSVTVGPALAANALVPPHGLGGAIAAVLVAAALSLAFASVEAWGWKRLHGATGVVYADLMLWGFLRRLRAERRLKQVGAAYQAAVGSDGVVRVELLEGLGHLLEIRNPYTYGHCRRVASHAERIARTLRLSAPEVAQIRTAALVHDVGKVYTPTDVLQKQGPLDDEEFAIVKRHAADGADMLAPVRDPELAAIVRHHHERVDGSGYPDGLTGPEIPLGSSIVAVADTFDAITSHRPYRRGRSQREALAVLEAERGRLLDAGAVDAFLRSYSPRRSIASVSLAGAISARIAGAFQLLPGGLLGGSSLAGVLPAVGAAGVLAVAPDARYERSHQAVVDAHAASLQAAFPGELHAQGGVPVAGTGGPAAGRPRARTRPLGRHVARTSPGAAVIVTPGAGTQGPAGAGGTSPGGSSPVSSGGGGQGTPPVAPGGKTEGPPVEVPEPPGVPPVTVPPVKAPGVEVPAVEVPAAKAPPVSTPSVTTPQVSVGAVAVPSVTVPSVTVQVPATPGVKVP